MSKEDSGRIKSPISVRLSAEDIDVIETYFVNEDTEGNVKKIFDSILDTAMSKKTKPRKEDLDKITDLEARLSASEIQNQNAKTEIDALTRQIVELKQQNEALRNDFQAELNDNGQAVEYQKQLVSVLQAENQQLTNEIAQNKQNALPENALVLVLNACQLSVLREYCNGMKKSKGLMYKECKPGFIEPLDVAENQALANYLWNVFIYMAMDYSFTKPLIPPKEIKAGFIKFLGGKG
jgi:hypothetical protein